MAEGSVLHRRLLGRELQQLREQAGVSLAEAARRLARADNAIRRFEAGQTMIDELQLSELCAAYGVDPELRPRLRDLRELARRPTWWSELGPRPEATASMLSMEEAARRILQFDHSAIPGLLQTPAYARANISAVEPDAVPSQVETDVRLRTERQRLIWHSGNPPEAIFLIDEASLWRMPGPPEAQRAQLSRLATPPPNATVQVIPFGSGPHASLGTYVIFDLDLGTSASARSVYVEGSAAQQGVIVEAESEITRYELTFERTRAKALTAKESARHIKRRIRGIPDD